MSEDIMNAVKNQKYIVDRKWKKVSVLMDTKTFDRMVDDLEELEDIRAYDKAKAKVTKESRNGDAVTLDEYLRT